MVADANIVKIGAKCLRNQQVGVKFITSEGLPTQHDISGLGALVMRRRGTSAIAPGSRFIPYIKNLWSFSLVSTLSVLSFVMGMGRVELGLRLGLRLSVDKKKKMPGWVERSKEIIRGPSFPVIFNNSTVVLPSRSSPVWSH